MKFSKIPFCFLLIEIMAKDDDHTLTNIEIFISETIQYYEKELSNICESIPDKYNYTDKTIASISLIYKSNDLDFDLLKYNIIQIIQSEINQMADLNKLLKEIFKKVDNFTFLIATLQSEINMNIIEEITSEAYNVYGNLLNFIYKYENTITTKKNHINLISHAQSKENLDKNLESLFKKASFTSNLDDNFTLISKTLKNIDLLINQLKTDAKKLDEKALKRKINYRKPDIKIKQNLDWIIYSINNMKTCTTNIKLIYEKLKVMNIDERNDINFKNFVVSEVNKFENYYNQILNFSYVFKHISESVEKGEHVYSTEDEEYINNCFHISCDMFDEYLDIKEEIIPILYFIYQNDNIIKSLDCLLKKAEEEFDFQKNKLKKDKIIENLYKDINSMNSELDELVKSMKNFPEKEISKAQFKRIFHVLNEKIKEFDQEINKFLCLSDGVYNKHLKNITSEDGLTKKYHKFCVDKLNAIKKDCDEFILRVKNDIFRNYQINVDNADLLKSYVDNKQSKVTPQDENLATNNIYIGSETIKTGLENKAKNSHELRRLKNNDISTSNDRENTFIILENNNSRSDDNILIESEIIEEYVDKNNNDYYKHQSSENNKPSYDINHKMLYIIIFIILLLFIPIFLYILLK
ncbi:hypothetical protein TCON_2044 [Astathelohania contejeani]|uniref:Reticulocyte binding protein n=1 Tax=Astathelohania contejeani TaxID=164912 RepID=A0ABQ7HX57_9MICR|nr:hypothetical protein TCON_2044 [Thelohania contejeani]